MTWKLVDRVDFMHVCWLGVGWVTSHIHSTYSECVNPFFVHRFIVNIVHMLAISLFPPSTHTHRSAMCDTRADADDGDIFGDIHRER